MLPSLQQYVLVSQSQTRIERYRRFSSGAWEYSGFTAGVVELHSGPRIDLSKSYDELPA